MTAVSLWLNSFPTSFKNKKRRVGKRPQATHRVGNLGLESLERRIVLSTVSGDDSAYVESSDSQQSSAEAMAQTSAEAQQSPVNVARIAPLLPMSFSSAQLLDDARLLLRGRILGEAFDTIVDIKALLTRPAEGQDTGILELRLGPIDLDVLGLVINTSPICLEITAEAGEGNLLGNLLTGIAGTLDRNYGLPGILRGLGGRLDAAEVRQLTREINSVIRAALNPTFDGAAVATAPADTTASNVCPILDLSIGPVNLDLLGLHVNLDNCADGPIEVSITAVEGPGNLLGNLLCGLTGLLDGTGEATSATDMLGLQLSSARLGTGNQLAISGNFMGEEFSQIARVGGVLRPPATGAETGILSLRLQPIHLDVLGLTVDTSEICLKISAVPGNGGLLGNLLTEVAGTLDAPVTLADVRSGLGGRLTAAEVTEIERQIGSLLRGAINQMLSRDVTPASPNTAAGDGICPILDLSVGPINLNLLGLKVKLDDCHNGPVEISVSAERGPGNLLGNLLCALVHVFDDMNTSEARARDRYFAEA